MTRLATPTALPDLRGTVAVITGAGGGIGAGIARQFSAAGAAVVLHYLTSKDQSAALAAELVAAGAEALTVRADITDPEQCVALMQAAVDAYGRLDALVNNSGVQPNEPLEDMTVEQWRAVVDTNVTGTFAATQAAVAVMRHSGGGSVTHIASIEGSHPARAHAHYCASKAAIIMHARTAALEYGAWGIRVNTVSPGLIDREGLAAAWPDGVQRWLANAPLGRMGASTDIGNACVFLASPMAAWITGHDLVVDGGMGASPTW
ncbi:SDR family NAD(P)-dependent oxidoreductase [Cellulomonas fimi]|uniref:Glucose 1-dehydrogenase n=1 Tax=Cellulomonas fimi TaxID=1708 RepID=A0A7Y0QGM5_CELFI|nr:glucose 1-dehydrogenase [Cellulomonas fimi]NMR19248.1 glucose 1-dehydrogenase [Cellulomonas fimi]